MTHIPVVGYLVGWSLHGSFQQDVAALRAAECGIADDLGFPRINSNGVYRRAVTTAARTARGDDRQVVVKLVEDSACFIAHEFLSTNVRDIVVSPLTDKSALFSHETMTRFDKVAYADGKPAEDLVQVEDAAHPIAAAVIAEYRRGAVDCEYSIGDMRVAFQRAFVRWAGLSILAHGGMWFLPTEHEAAVYGWERYVNGWKGCRATVWPQYNCDRIREEIKVASAETLEAQLAQVLEDLERFGARDNVRLSTLESRVKAFDTLRARAELFERMLGHSMGELKARLDAAQAALVAAITQIQQ